MKKYFIITIFIITILSAIDFIFPNTAYATSIFDSMNIDELNFNSIDKNKVDDFKNAIETLKQSISNSSDNSNTSKLTLDIEKIVMFYDELTKVVSDDEISNFISDNKSVFIKSGINEDVIDTSCKIFKTFDSNAIIEIVQEDLDLDEVLKVDESDFSIDDVVISLFKNTTTSTKIKIILKLLFTNNYFKMAFALFIAVAIYSVYITSLIFKKAGKEPYITLIPIYRDMVHLKICNFSPWLIILLFIPFIGWLALMAIAVISRFELAKNFGYGFFFGLGLLFFPIIFRTYLALSQDKYIGEH